MHHSRECCFYFLQATKIEWQIKQPPLTNPPRNKALLRACKSLSDEMPWLSKSLYNVARFFWEPFFSEDMAEFFLNKVLQPWQVGKFSNSGHMQCFHICTKHGWPPAVIHCRWCISKIKSLKGWTRNSGSKIQHVYFSTNEIPKEWIDQKQWPKNNFFFQPPLFETFFSRWFLCDENWAWNWLDSLIVADPRFVAAFYAVFGGFKGSGVFNENMWPEHLPCEFFYGFYPW